MDLGPFRSAGDHFRARRHLADGEARRPSDSSGVPFCARGPFKGIGCRPADCRGRLARLLSRRDRVDHRATAGTLAGRARDLRRDALDWRRHPRHGRHQSTAEAAAIRGAARFGVGPVERPLETAPRLAPGLAAARCDCHRDRNRRTWRRGGIVEWCAGTARGRETRSRRVRDFSSVLAGARSLGDAVLSQSRPPHVLDRRPRRALARCNSGPAALDAPASRFTLLVPRGACGGHSAAHLGIDRGQALSLPPFRGRIARARRGRRRAAWRTLQDRGCGGDGRPRGLRHRGRQEDS